jgi:hypothetical protein
MSRELHIRGLRDGFIGERRVAWEAKLPALGISIGLSILTFLHILGLVHLILSYPIYLN